MSRRLPGRMTWQAKARSLCPRRYGATGDGVTDDAPAFNRTLEKAADRGRGFVHIPAGTYRINSPLRVPRGVALVGESSSSSPRATLLLAEGGEGHPDGEPLITLEASSCLRSVTIHYPQQRADRVVPYPWTIRVAGTHAGILDLHITNAYQAIDLDGHAASRHHVRNIRGQPLYRGLRIGQGAEMGKLEGVQFGPHWQHSEPVLHSMRELGIAFDIKDCDWEYVSNCSATAYRIGFLFGAGTGGPSNALFTQCSSECRSAVRIEHVHEPAGVSFRRGSFNGGIEIGPKNSGPVRFSECSFGVAPPVQSVAVLQGKCPSVFAACDFHSWDHDCEDHPAIRLDQGSLTISDSRFLASGKRQVVAGPDATSLAIFTSQLRGGERVEIAPGVDCQIGLNTYSDDELSVR